VPILVVKANIEDGLIDKRGNVQPSDRLHQVGRATLVPPRSKVGTNHEGLHSRATRATWPK
jgi:hypothetical protein